MVHAATRLPNFFIAGAPHAGTTSLYAYLSQHPEVYMSPIKEPTFFGATDLLSPPYGARVSAQLQRSRPALRTYLEGVQAPGAMYWVLDWEDYRVLFRNARAETAIGEASVSYIWLPSAARSIRARVPHARLIFVLRDPAERLFMRYLAGGGTSRRSFRDQFRAALNPGDSWATTVNVGRYATHLQRFFDVFPRDRMRFYLYEDYRGDPQSVLRDAFAFLGVDPHHPVDLSLRHHETLVPRLPGLESLRRTLFGNASIPRWLPGGARSALRRLYRRRASEIAMDPADRTMVIAHYADEIRRTGDLIGRDLSRWLR